MFKQGSMFQDFVVWSGFALLGLVLLRAVTLWIAVGKKAPAGACGHDHGDHHHHEGACDHDHAHHHHDHDHGHSHAHGPAHSHAACHAGHEHGFAPWRYIVLLVPIILFLLGLPNQGPKATAHDVAITGVSTEAAPAFAAVVGMGPLPLPQLVVAAAAAGDASTGTVAGMDFKSLETVAQDDFSRKEWKGKMVRVVGQFGPMQTRNDHIFSLVRFRIQCCAADAVAFRIPVLSRESVAGIPANQWVDVTGRVEFQRKSDGGGYMTVLIVPRRQHIVLTNPDPNPYIQ
jgi:hypothetical protein